MPSHDEMACELVRALRGRRSQANLSRRLGYRSNALHTWEVGSAFPYAHRFFELAERVGVDVSAGLKRFFRDVPVALRGAQLSRPEGITALVRELKGRIRVGELAASTGLSRFSLSRWLSGKAQPNLPDLLRYVEHTSLRVLDFLAIVVDPAQLPSVSAGWAKLQAARALGYERPETRAVLHGLETTRYRARPTAATLAALTGIPEAKVLDDLRALEASGQVRRRGKRYIPRPQQAVDLRREPLEAQAVKAHWAAVAAERTLRQRPGLFAYNLFSVSHADLDRLIALQRAYLREMRAIIAKSEPNEVVALANFQLFSMADSHDDVL